MVKRLSADEVYISGLSAEAAEALAGGGGEAGATAAKQDTQITALGAIADAAVAAGATGSIAAKLRAISRDLIANIVLAAGTAIIGGTRDAGPQWTSVFGVAGARFTSANASAVAAAVSDVPTNGQKIVVTDVLVSVDTAMRVDLKEETSGTVVASLYLPANSSVQFTPRGKLKLAVADKKLTVQTSVAGNVAVTAFYYSEA